MVVQEAVVLSRLVTRIMRALSLLKEGEFAVARIYSDSESALKLVKALDLPRRSRHIDIKIEWLRELVGNKYAVLHHLRGDFLVADLLTQCLQTNRYMELRQAMGFVQKPMTAALLSLVRPRPKFSGFALLEVCCDEKSMLRAMCLEKNIPYRGITAGVETRAVLDEARNWMYGLKVNLHVHLSTLCSSGSPLRRFSMDVPSELDAAWDSHIKGATSFMSLGQSTSFELPLINDIWRRWFVKKTLEKFNHNHSAVVHLCQTGLQASDDNFIGKRLKFSTDLPELAGHLHEKFGVCRCQQNHANFNFVTWRRTAFYNRCLAEEFICGLEKRYGKAKS
jgi:hypothetical protein